MSHSMKSVSLLTVAGKNDKTREYSLSSSTALLVVCRHASDGGKSTIYYSTLPPGYSRKSTL